MALRGVNWVRGWGHGYNYSQIGLEGGDMVIIIAKLG